MKKETKKLEGINPFVINNPIKCRRMTEERFISDTPTPEGYVPAGMTLRNTYLVDVHRKTSLYNLGMETMTDLFFNKLSAKSKDLFLYIMIHLPHNQDYIRLPYTTLAEDCKMSRTTVMRAIQELRAAGIIQNKNQSVYWVNPNYLFSGSRYKFYKEVGDDYLIEA